MKALEISKDEQFDLLYTLVTDVIDYAGDNKKIIVHLISILKHKNILQPIIKRLTKEGNDESIIILTDALIDDNDSETKPVIEKMFSKINQIEKRISAVDQVVDTSDKCMFREYWDHCESRIAMVEDRARLKLVPGELFGEVDTGDVICCTTDLEDCCSFATSHASLGVIQIWDINTMKHVRSFGEGVDGMHNVWEMVRIPDTDLLVSASPDTPGLNVFNWKSGKLVNHIEHDYAISGLGHPKTFAFGKKYVAAGLQDRSVTIFDITKQGGTKKLVLGGHEDWVFSCVVCPKGRLITGSAGTLVCWNVDKQIKEFIVQAHDGYITALMLLDATTLISGSDEGTIKVWDMESRCCTKILMAQGCPIMDLCLVGANTAISGGQDGTVRFWDISSRETVVSFKTKGKAITCVKFCPYSEKAVVGCADRMLRVYAPQRNPDRQETLDKNAKNKQNSIRS
jgi:WD40 repeat protein